MRVFVTGGSGFIGRHVLAALLRRGADVVALSGRGGAPRESHSVGPEWVQAPLGEVPAASLRGCDAIIHLAAYGVTSGGDDWEGCFRTNVIDSLRLWKVAAEAGVRRHIVCGSCFEYGRAGERFEYIPVDCPLEPTGAYHASKAAATLASYALAIDQALSTIVLRPFHVYGEGEHPNRLWPALKRAAEKGEDFPMTRGEQVRDFVDVTFVARKFVETLDETFEPGKASIRNVGSGKPQTILRFCESWWREWGARGRLLPGAIPYRKNEVMRYCPQL